MGKYNIERISQQIRIGWDGENNWRPQTFDCSSLLATRPNGTVTLWILPNGESEAFPVALTADGNLRTWTPLDSELVGGGGKLQFHCQDGEDVGKSPVYRYVVEGSLLTGAEHPDETPSWAVQVVADVQDAIDGIGETVEEMLPDAVEDYMVEHPFVETDPTVPAWAKATQKPSYTAAEVGALPDSYTAPVQSVNTKTGAVVLSASDVGAMPSSYVAPVTSVNGQTGAVSLRAADVNALPAGTSIPSKTSDLTNDSGFITASDVPYVTPQQFGAKGDGITDDTEAINSCFASGASNIYFPKGTYLVDAHHAGFGDETEGGLKPKSNSVITLDADATIKCSTSPTDFYNILHFVNVDNVIVQGGRIVGDKATHVQISQPTYEFGHGVGIQNSTNIVVRDMEISGCIGDGVIFNYSGNHNVTLDNLTIHDCRRQGISLTSGDGIVITNCEIYDIDGTAPQAGIDIEPDGERSVVNVVIDNCNIHDTVGASVITANVQNVIDQIHISGCLLDYMFFTGGSNVTMNGCKSARVTVKCDNAAVISASSIEEIWVAGGSAVFAGCNFISSGKGKFINFLSDVISTPVDHIVFNDCYFDVTNCTHFLYVPGNGIDKVKSIEFKDCSAKITHAVTGSYASSGFSNYPPAKMVISGSKFEFTAKIYQLFTAKAESAITLEITDSEIVNSNSYRTNYFLSGNAAYDVWIEHSKLMNYGNMLYGGGDATTGEVVLLNDTFDFSNPVGKTSADGATITNISRENTKYLSGVTSNVQAQINSKAAASDVSALSARLNALADSDDTTLDQLSEIVAYIKNNKALIDNITTGKVSVSDIVDNLTSTATNKPLSANQGRALKALIDAIVVPTESTVAGWGFTKNTGTYSKPGGGIPKTDLASAVQTSLGKADTALQSHQSLAAYRTSAAQDTIDAGKANSADLATVAFSGDYNDLDDKPSIPSLTGYATQTWVTQQGYLTLADLPIYNGGVS